MEAMDGPVNFGNREVDFHFLEKLKEIDEKTVHGKAVCGIM